MSLTSDDLVLCAGTLESTPILDRIDAIIAAGFQGTSSFTTDVQQAEAEGVPPKELGKRLADAGLGVAEMDMVSNWFPSATPGPGLLGFTNEQAFDYAEALNARSVTAVVFAAAPSQDELIDSFAALCDQAAERGLLVHLEFIPFSPVRTLGDALAIVEAANRPNGGIMLDAWHLYRSGGTASDVQAAAKHILGVQLDDAPVEPEKNLVAETTQRRLLPGQGDADVPAIIRALRSGGSTAPLGVEVFSETLAALPPEEVARQAFAAAKDCIKKSL